MDDNTHNELDKLFQSKLESFGAKKEAWNTPSDEVFSKAMAQVEPKKKRRFPFAWFIFGTLLVSSLITIGIQHHKVNLLESNLHQLQNELSHLETPEISENQTSLSSNIGTTQPASNDDIVIKNATNDYSTTTLNFQSLDQEKTSKSIHKNLKNNPPQPGKTNNLPTVQMSSATSFNQSNEMSESNDQVMQMIDAETKNTATVDREISEFNPLSTLLGSIEIGPIQLQDVPVIPVTEKKKHQTSTFISWASELSTFQMTHLPDSDFDLTKYDQYYHGYSVGAGFRYHISPKWSVQSKLAWHKTYNKSEFQNEMLYDKQNEVTDQGGITTYTTDVDVISPVGPSTESMTLNVSQMQIDDQESLINHTFIDQNYSIFSLNLTPRYHFINNEKLNASIGIGARLNYLLHCSEKMYISLYHDNQELQTETVSHTELPLINSWFGGISGDVDINYNINNHFTLGLSSGYYKSLTSIKNYNNIDQARTFLNSFNLNLNFYLKL